MTFWIHAPHGGSLGRPRDGGGEGGGGEGDGGSGSSVVVDGGEMEEGI